MGIKIQHVVQRMPCRQRAHPGHHALMARRAGQARQAVVVAVDRREHGDAARRGGEAADNHVWIVQTDNAALADLITGSGWLDLRALPDTPDVAGWQQEMAETLPLLRPLHPSAADIVFRHAAMTPAEPF